MDTFITVIMIFFIFSYSIHTFKKHKIRINSFVNLKIKWYFRWPELHWRIDWEKQGSGSIYYWSTWTNESKFNFIIPKEIDLVSIADLNINK